MNYTAIAVNKDRQKEYGTPQHSRVVYLENETEFQIELFNPFHHEVGISIATDEKFESKQLLILKPGERFWLDRPLDVQKKFKFVTYEVENSQEAKSAIAENGDVVIKYYKVKENKPQITYQRFDWKPEVRGIRKGGWDPFGGGRLYRSSSISHKVEALDSDVVCNYNATVKDCDNSLRLEDMVLTSSCADTTIETGRIEEGSVSNQSFNEVNKDFENYPICTERIKILPLSQKPITTAEISKKFCWSCGKKIKEKFKFCPNCGTEQ